MQTTTALYTQSQNNESVIERVKSWLRVSENKTITSWIVEQLRIQSYQHILEVGFGTGSTLFEVAKKLEVGFVAGIDDSVVMYQQAIRKNKKFIDQDLMQLHLGTVEELPYPSQYFHNIYAGNIYTSWKEPQYKFMQLNSLLKHGGKLITVFQPRQTSEKEIWNEAEKALEQYAEAGFCDVRFALRDMHAGTAVAVVGHKQ
jgi:ubiquinone/menaquinone biosynthesis C-methylase UbiE